jgi:hypothetical protein
MQPYGLMVLTMAAGGIAAIVGFPTQHRPAFERALELNPSGAHHR